MTDEKMIQEISSRKRILDDIYNSDIIYKKAKVQKMFQADPDLRAALDEFEKLPLNTYKDKNNPTEAEKKERNRILDYNKKIDKPQIVPWIKVNNIQTEVMNFLMFDIYDERMDYDNSYYKRQILQVMILVHEDDMETEYGIPRTDLIDYIVKDLLCGTNYLGLRLLCSADTFQITDNQYYCRTINFRIQAPNTNEFRAGNTANSHESW